LRVKPSPRNRIVELLRKEPGLTRSQIAERLGITYWAARYWTEVLVREGVLRKEVVYSVRRFVRRIQYFVVVPVVYYRTSYAIMFYAVAPRTKSPDPIAEMRVTAVSNVKGKYRLEEFERACIYIGVILAPQTYWMKQEREVTADELDEPIDVDELPYSVPVYKRLNYAERYAVFFRSRRREEEKWRSQHPYWWATPEEPLPTPREGDFEYDEKFIKDMEEKQIALGQLKMRFNNELGIMESVV
jgi:DNA-binding Lrp family transcriptional regulator